jgi:hypothetical protein
MLFLGHASLLMYAVLDMAEADHAITCPIKVVGYGMLLSVAVRAICKRMARTTATWSEAKLQERKHVVDGPLPRSSAPVRE